MINSIKQLHYDGLWCYIGGYLDCDDDIAQKLADQCITQGVTTWQQLTELNHADRQQLLRGMQPIK